MEKIIIEYDSKNSLAKKLVDFIIESNIFKVEKVKTRKTGLDEALEDVEKGNITSCEDFEEYKEVTRKIVGHV